MENMNNQTLTAEQKEKKNIKFVASVITVIIYIIIGYFVFSVIGNLLYSGYKLATDETYLMIGTSDKGLYSTNSVYEKVETCKKYYENHGITEEFVDITGWDANFIFEEYMYNNEYYVGAYVVVEGAIVEKDGEYIYFEDSVTFNELEEVIAQGISPETTISYNVVNLSFTDKSASEFAVGQEVTIVGMYCGILEFEDGTPAPCIVPVDIYNKTYNNYGD